MIELRGTVTQRSNGRILIALVAGAAAERIEIHQGWLGSKQLPEMGDDVVVSVDITETANEKEVKLSMENSDPNPITTPSTPSPTTPVPPVPAPSPTSEKTPVHKTTRGT